MYQQSKNKLIEFIVYTVLFAISWSFLPICNFYYLGKKEIMITKPQYFYDFSISYVFPLYFALVIFAFLSLNKAILITINILVLIFALLTYVLIELGFTWWGGSPFRPDFQAGYWFSQCLILIVIIRTFAWIKRFPEIHLSRKATRLFSILAITIPLIFMGYLIIFYTNAKNKPIMRSEWEQIERNRMIKVEDWDYLKANRAFVSKYYSTDTLKKATFKLDSAQFSFFDDHSNIVKRFTRKASNNELDIEEILEENE